MKTYRKVVAQKYGESDAVEKYVELYKKAVEAKAMLNPFNDKTGMVAESFRCEQIHGSTATHIALKAIENIMYGQFPIEVQNWHHVGDVMVPLLHDGVPAE